MTRPPEQLVLPPPRTYTRTDFAALRAFVQRVPPATIARLYFDPEAPPAASSEHTERYLRQMRDDLVQLALLHGSTVLADHLKQSIRKHGSAQLTAVSLRMVEQASKLAAAAPLAAHAVGLWFRPLVAQRLAGEGIATLGELVATCNRRGGSWWRSVPRIGLLRARTIVAWLRRHAGTLGVTVTADVDATDPLVAPVVSHVVIDDARDSPLAPLERIELPHVLSGAQGTNRMAGLCYLQAQHDLDAIRSYLHRYRDRPQALRAYTRELERLLLWAVTERGRPLSSLDVDDCEAYKSFLASPADRFTGPRCARSSSRWRPFAPEGLSADSQRYAVRALQAAFEWLVKVRYLAGNPWAAVTLPATIEREHAMQIERALPVKLWRKLRELLDRQAQLPGSAGVRWRAARAAILLMGDSGLRITEASIARRERLRYHAADDDVPAGWELQVLGKGRKQRTVPLSPACMSALREHWADLGADFNAPPASAPLMRPVWIPPTTAAQRRHGVSDTGPAAAQLQGYSSNGLRALTGWAIVQLLETEAFSEDERRQLASTTPHAYRHTLGSQAPAAGVPLEVLQQMLGHASLQTTTIYAQAEKRRVRRELAGYFGQLQQPGNGAGDSS